MTYYRSTVTDVGPEVAEVSVVHRPSQTLEGHTIGVGDTVLIGGSELTITAVGDIATKNLDELGHVVLYVNHEDQKTLPGSVQADGELPAVEVGQTLEFRAGS